MTAAAAAAAARAAAGASRLLPASDAARSLAAIWLQRKRVGVGNLARVGVGLWHAYVNASVRARWAGSAWRVVHAPSCKVACYVSTCDSGATYRAARY